MTAALTWISNLPEFQRELIKLALQFFGGLIIAWLAVRWALSRFKTEKMWERRTTSLADVLSALREMERVYSIWLNDYFLHQDTSSPHLSERLSQARAKFESVSGIAILVLPTSLAETIEQIEAELNKEREEDWFQHIDQKSAVLSRSIEKLLKEAEKHQLYRT